MIRYSPSPTCLETKASILLWRALKSKKGAVRSSATSTWKFEPSTIMALFTILRNRRGLAGSMFWLLIKWIHCGSIPYILPPVNWRSNGWFTITMIQNLAAILFRFWHRNRVDASFNILAFFTFMFCSEMIRHQQELSIIYFR